MAVDIVSQLPDPDGALVLQSFLSNLFPDGYSFPDAAANAKRGKFSVCCKIRDDAPAAKDCCENTFILKRSVVSEMEPRNGEKWARDVLSFRAEFALYGFFGALATSKPLHAAVLPTTTLWPAVRGLTMSGFEPPRTEESLEDFKPPDDARVAMVLEDLEAAGYVQKPELSRSELEVAVLWLADFHAATLDLVGARNLQEGGGGGGVSAGGDPDNTGDVKDFARGLWPMGTFFTKDKRGDANWRKELDGMDRRWRAFADTWKEVFELDETLGARLQDAAEKIAAAVRELDRTVVVHGDGKTANMFFHGELFEKEVQRWEAAERGETSDLSELPHQPSVRWIDFQWSGFGSPLLDIVYLVVSSGAITEKENPTTDGGGRGEKPPETDAEIARLLIIYFTRFVATAQRLGKTTTSIESFCFDLDGVFMAARVREYKLVFLDYARVVVSYMWDGAVDPALMAKRKKGPNAINFCIHNRSEAHVKWFSDVFGKFLGEVFQ